MKPSAPSGTVVSNSGPLIALAKVNQIHLLYPLYGTVSIPAAVYEEAALAGLARGEADALSIEMAYLNRHLQIVELTENQLLARITNLPLDWGEKYAIQLAINEKAKLLLLDDLQARNEAKKFGFTIKGTLGVPVDAARQKFVNFTGTRACLRDDSEAGRYLDSRGSASRRLESLQNSKNKA